MRPLAEAVTVTLPGLSFDFTITTALPDIALMLAEVCCVLFHTDGCWNLSVVAWSPLSTPAIVALPETVKVISFVAAVSRLPFASVISTS